MDRQELEKLMNQHVDINKVALAVVHIADCIQELTEAVKALAPPEVEQPEPEERAYFGKPE